MYFCLKTYFYNNCVKIKIKIECKNIALIKLCYFKIPLFIFLIKMNKVDNLHFYCMYVCNGMFSLDIMSHINNIVQIFINITLNTNRKYTSNNLNLKSLVRFHFVFILALKHIDSHKLQNSNKIEKPQNNTFIDPIVSKAK